MSDRGKTVLERVEHLIALSTSPNENEARTAAMLAVQLIRKHKLVLSMPVRTSERGIRAAPASRRKTTPRGVKRVVDPPERIVAPLGGDCIQCGGRYRAEQTIFWVSSLGGLHVRCLEEFGQGVKK
jgi:hypothetical protein